MGEFIQNNILWLTPVVSIIFTVIIKISAKPEFMTLSFVDYLDFGFDLSISAVIALLTGIKNDAGIWLLLGIFILLMVTSTIVNRIGWSKETRQLKVIGAIIPDIVGVFILVVATLYLGGVIK